MFIKGRGFEMWGVVWTRIKKFTRGLEKKVVWTPF